MAIHGFATDEGAGVPKLYVQPCRFKKTNPDFQPEQLSKIGFVFDKTKNGTILIGNIGIQNEDVAVNSSP